MSGGGAPLRRGGMARILSPELALAVALLLFAALFIYWLFISGSSAPQPSQEVAFPAETGGGGMARVPPKAEQPPLPQAAPTVPNFFAEPTVAPQMQAAAPVPVDTGPMFRRFDRTSTAPPPAPAAASAPQAEPAAAAGERAVTYAKTKAEVTEASVMGDLSRTLKPTTKILCMLDTALDGTRPGPLFCHTQGDTWSWDHSTVLIPGGTPIVGTYQPLSTGDHRMMAMAATVYRSDGLFLDLGADPVADPLGQLGMTGNVDNRFWERVGNALITDAALTALQLPGQALQSRGSGNTNLSFNAGSTEGVVGQVLQSTVNLPPLFHKNQHEYITILVLKPAHMGALQYRAN